MEGADQKLVLITKVHIESGPPHVGAVENLLDDDGVVVSLVNQRVKRVAEQLLRPCHAPVCFFYVLNWTLAVLEGHLSPSCGAKRTKRTCCPLMHSSVLAALP